MDRRQRIINLLKAHPVAFTLVCICIISPIVTCPFLETNDIIITAMYVVVISLCSILTIFGKRGYGVKKWNCFRMLKCSLVDSTDDYQGNPIEDFTEVTNPAPGNGEETEQSVESQAQISEGNVTERRSGTKPDHTVVTQADVHQPDTDSPLQLSPSISLPSKSSPQHSDPQQSVSGFATAPSSIELPSTDSNPSFRSADILDD